ncbi:MAG: hypothetical protein LBC08_01990 [Campylobacteraceae bacterium]|jgi:hypothetical protein|nr:hypothetical protein [Campylobacteraceae bacterium]
MFCSLTKLGFSLSILIGFFLIGCGGRDDFLKDSSYAKKCNLTDTACYTVSFYDENLRLIEAQSVKEGQVNPSDILLGVWYMAGEEQHTTSYNLMSNVNFYADQNVKEITDQAGLNSVRDKLQGKYIVLEDIVLDSGKEGFNASFGWEPIGSETAPFSGIFNANHHVISGLWIDRPNTSNTGLFGYVNGTKIMNVGVKIANGKKLNGKSFVGGIAGQVVGDSLIKNSYAEGDIEGSDSDIGGIAGKMNGGKVEGSYFKGDIKGKKGIAGIVGSANDDVSIISSYSNGYISGTSSHIGGIVGWSQDSGKIEKSYSTMRLEGDGGDIGGIVGIINNSALVSNSAAINPSIKGQTKTNRIAYSDSNTAMFSNNFALKNMLVNGKTVSGDNGMNGIDKTNEEFKKESTYKELGWEFGDDDEHPWKIFEDVGYPYLYWEKR